MEISIVGAGGTIGRQIAIGLAHQKILPATGRLQLVGHAGGPSEQTLPGIAADLADAFAEDIPEIDLAFSPADVLGDIIIIAAGATVGPGGVQSRQDLAGKNADVVDSCARAIAQNGHGEELVLVLTNPVEASVSICCRHLDRRRVFGMGAYLDTLRFRREIAAELGVRRQRVQGLVLGEHGPRMVPCWSTVSVYGFGTPDGQARLNALQRPSDPTAQQACDEIAELVRTRGARAAFDRAEMFGPALRAAVKSNIAQLSGARTPAGTAEMILRLLSTLISGGRVMTAAQVLLEGEFLGIHGVVGAPVVMTLGGMDRLVSFDLPADERAAVLAAVYRDPSGIPTRTVYMPGTKAETRAYRCVLTMKTSTRPGVLERIVAIFAERGINLDEVQASAQPQAGISLRFSASETVKDYLARRLMRVAEVSGVAIEAV